jgi:hypothetical protein
LYYFFVFDGSEGKSQIRTSIPQRLVIPYSVIPGIGVISVIPGTTTLVGMGDTGALGLTASGCGLTGVGAASCLATLEGGALVIGGLVGSGLVEVTGAGCLTGSGLAAVAG